MVYSRRAAHSNRLVVHIPWSRKLFWWSIGLWSWSYQRSFRSLAISIPGNWGAIFDVGDIHVFHVGRKTRNCVSDEEARDIIPLLIFVGLG